MVGATYMWEIFFNENLLVDGINSDENRAVIMISNVNCRLTDHAASRMYQNRRVMLNLPINNHRMDSLQEYMQVK